jgi:methyltransferase (TIGR00027 family)
MTERRPLLADHTQPSQTAMTAAAARAAHLIVDAEPYIFADPLAETLLGDRADEFLTYHRLHGTHLVLAGARAQAVCRSRYTEQLFAAGLDRDITQVVILGAGLDSFAYRSQLAPGVRVFELDHPATQKWKRAQLAAAGIAEPDHVAYVPIDFERDALADRLRDNGFDPTRPAIVSWLGVTMYLTEPAITETLTVVGGFAAGSEIVADYMLPGSYRDEAGRAYVDLLGPTMAERGEPWLTFLSPDAATALLHRHGFTAVEHLRQRDLGDELWQRADALRPADLSVIAHAVVG